MWALVEPGLPLPAHIYCMSTVKSVWHFPLCSKLGVGVLRASLERGHVSTQGQRQAGVSIPEVCRCTELTHPYVLAVSGVVQISLWQIIASWCLKARLLRGSTWTESCFKVPQDPCYCIFKKGVLSCYLKSNMDLRLVTSCIPHPTCLSLMSDISDEVFSSGALYLWFSCTRDLNKEKSQFKLTSEHNQFWNAAAHRFVCCIPLTALSSSSFSFHHILPSFFPLGWGTACTADPPCPGSLGQEGTRFPPWLRHWLSQSLWVTDLYSTNVAERSQKLL